MHSVSTTSLPTLPSERQPGFNDKHCHSGNMTRESIATGRGLAPQRERSWRLYRLTVSNGLRPSPLCQAHVCTKDRSSRESAPSCARLCALFSK